MAIVTYTNEQGLKKVVEVPYNLVDKTQYRHGILLGPPDLSSIGLNSENTRLLNDALCDLGILDYATMSGRRHQALEAIKTFVFDDQQAKEILGSLIALYQQESLIYLEESNYE